jgi:hypothetical protein
VSVAASGGENDREVPPWTMWLPLAMVQVEGGGASEANARGELAVIAIWAP